MTVLYRKYRPQKLADLVGQDHIKKTLSAQLATGKISHAYLFSGPKGTGKTTTARILAKAVNCKKYDKGRKDTIKALKASLADQVVFGEPCNQCDSCLAVLQDRHLDVIEIDAASNRGIDDVRSLRESIKLAPISARFKVYIVDEVHMLTTEAANALLKTLEEPPAHAIFILATTTPEKMPETIISRCQAFLFFPATKEQLLESLKKVVVAEGAKLSDEIFAKIAEKSDGSYRDGFVLLEKVLSQKELDEATLTSLLAGVDFGVLAKLAQKLSEKNAKEAILLLNNLIAQGVSAQAINSEFVQFLRNLLFVKVGVFEPVGEKRENSKELTKLSQNFSQNQILELLKLFETASQQKNSPIAQLPQELAIAQFCLASPKS